MFVAVYSGAIILVAGTFISIQSSYSGIRQIQPYVELFEQGPYQFVGPKNEIAETNETGIKFGIA